MIQQRISGQRSAYIKNHEASKITIRASKLTKTKLAKLPTSL
uniref:Uncharacterized protein n=1 Tax=Arundo donax TaxID=35708 RepID=A0A0A9FSA5_ARUDO